MPGWGSPHPGFPFNTYAAMLVCGLLSKIWKRPALSRAFLDYHARLEVEGVEFVGVCAVSPHEDPFAVELLQRGFRPWVFTPAPNRPLSDKGNAAMRAMQTRQPDLVINLGSDDFVSQQFVASEVFFYDAEDHRACRQYQNHGLKAGAAMSRRALEAASWQPWRAGDVPDQDLDAGLRPIRPVYLPEGSGAVVDVKAGGEQISNYATASTANRFIDPADPDTLLSQFPGLVEAFDRAGIAQRHTGVPVGA